MKATSNQILLVEDNLSDIALAKRAFKKAKIANDLVVAEDGQEAFDYLYGKGKYSNRDVTDMPIFILLDLKLPKMSGIELLQRIRENKLTHRILVVVLSTSKEEKDKADCYDLNVNSYIQKPVDFYQFAETVKTLAMYWLGLNEPPPLPT